MKHNAKLTYVFPCVALEDMSDAGLGRVARPHLIFSQTNVPQGSHLTSLIDLDGRLREADLG